MKRSNHHLFLVIILFIFSISVIKELPARQVQASIVTEDTLRSYLNVVCKNLYLGVPGKKTFDFDIKKEALMEGATYRWYIVEDKGDPYVARIDSETGVVTAQSAGTAYIGCRITLADNTVLRPEAKVVVINNITEVGISNIPEDGILAIGSTMDFNHMILNTTAGKGKVSSGIVRWEIANDTAGVGAATETGVVVPQKVGSFDIRVVCFQRIEDYNSWKTNKNTKAGKITAASEWITVTTISTLGEATTLEQLKELLAAENITQITFSIETKQKITIPEGDYSDKTLIVDTPNTNITNYGVFKLIIIKSENNSIWKEYGSNNVMEIYDSKINLIITEKAQVKSIVFGTSQIQSFSSDKDITLANTAYVSVAGKIDRISIAAATKLVLTGSGVLSKLLVEETADGTMLAISVASDFVSNADIVMTLYEGSEAISVNISSDSNTKIENLSLASIGIDYGLSYVLSGPGYALQISSGVYTLLGKADTGSVIRITPTYNLPITTAAVRSGTGLWSCTLNGTFYDNSTKVEGTLSWVTLIEIVNETRYYQWIFTPFDTKHYNAVYGMALVEVIK